MRWFIWVLLLISTSGTSTLASRARNTPSLMYHALAALGSHGTFIVSQLIGLDILVEVLRTHDWHRATVACLVYASASTTGSILSHVIAMKFLERGNRRVGSYKP